MNKISLSRWICGLCVPLVAFFITRNWNEIDSMGVPLAYFEVSTVLTFAGAWWATQEKKQIHWGRFFTYITQVSFGFYITLSTLPTGLLNIVLMVTCGTLIASGNHISRRYRKQTHQVDADNPCNPPRNSKNQLDD